MFTHPDQIGQLVRDHHNQMLAQASRRQLRHQHGRPAPSTANGAAQIARRPVTAIARASAATAQALRAIWPAGPHPLGGPAGQAQIPGRSH